MKTFKTSNGHEFVFIRNHPFVASKKYYRCRNCGNEQVGSRKIPMQRWLEDFSKNTPCKP